MTSQSRGVLAKRPIRAVLVVGALVMANAWFSLATRPTLWIENRSSQDAIIFVDDLGSGPAPWYVVPAHSSGHAGSDGLDTSAVRVNVLGWRHEENRVGPCAPGDFDDTLYDVPRSASVQLLIEESGEPSVRLAPEPPDLVHLVQVPLGSMSEAERCAESTHG